MNTLKKLSGFSAALLLSASMGTAYAEESDMTQTQIQDRTQLNLQTPNSGLGQAQNRTQQKVMNKNQNQYKYKYKNGYQTGDSDSAGSSTNRQNTMRFNQGNTGNGMTNRQSSANRSMSGGGRR